MSQILAILLGLLAYAVLNIGLVLEKKGADTLPAIEATSAWGNMKNFLGCKIWLLGLILTSMQWVFLFWALALAPLSLITPLLGVGLAVLTIFSHFYLHETIKRIELMGIGIIIVGIALIGSTALPETSEYTVQEMFGLFGTAPALLFLLGISVAAALLCSYSILKEYKFAPAIVFGFAAGVGAGIGGTFTKGMTSGFNNLSAAVGDITWWLMLLIMIAGNLFSLVFLQIGFQKGKAVIVAPIYSVLGMILPVLSGIIILGEWNTQPLVNIILQIVGLIVITVGIIILSFYGEKKKSKAPSGI